MESARKAVGPQLRSRGLPRSRTTLGMMVETRNQPKAWIATPSEIVQIVRAWRPNSRSRQLGESLVVSVAGLNGSFMTALAPTLYIRLCAILNARVSAVGLE